MGHPFTSQRRGLILYILVWTVIAILSVVLLRFGRNFSVVASLSDGFITAFIFGLLGLIAWYPTSYIPFRKETPLYSLFAHIAAGVLVIAAWLLLSYGILSVLLGNDEVYIRYLNDTLVPKGFVGVMIYLVLVLIYYLISYSRSLREKAQAEEKLRTLVKESELSMLKSQINPHFLFNSLNSISSLIINNPNKAHEMIIRLSDFLRYSLKHRENKFVSLNEEIGRMKDYLAIEQIRFGEKLSYSFEISKECQNIPVPTMIMQPLVENAIKHGVYESLEPVSVSFKCQVQRGVMQLELKNDFDPDQPSRPGTGVGLQNVSERLKLAYDSKGRMSRSNNDGVFSVTLYIPLEKI